MNAAGTDAYYLMEMFLLAAAPFGLIAAGIVLRRKFSVTASTDEAQASAQTPGRRIGRFLGTFLLWSGILSVLFCIIVFLNYRGIL